MVGRSELLRLFGTVEGVIHQPANDALDGLIKATVGHTVLVEDMERTHGTEYTTEKDGEFEQTHCCTCHAVQTAEMDILKNLGKDVCGKSEHNGGYYPKDKEGGNAGNHVALTAIYRKIGPECGIAGNRDEEADEETYTRGR